MTLTIYDAAMVGVIVAGMLWGAWRGVTWQIASIASLILGYITSHQLSPQLASRFGTDPVISRTLAMMAIYAVVSGGVFLVAWIFRAILRRMKFEAFDRHLGMLLGGMEGAILGTVITFFVVSLAPQTRDPDLHEHLGQGGGERDQHDRPDLEGRDRRCPRPVRRGVQAGRLDRRESPPVPADGRRGRRRSQASESLQCRNR